MIISRSAANSALLSIRLPLIAMERAAVADLSEGLPVAPLLSPAAVIISRVAPQVPASAGVYSSIGAQSNRRNFTIDIKCLLQRLTVSALRRNQEKRGASAWLASRTVVSQLAAAQRCSARQPNPRSRQTGWGTWLSGLGVRAPLFWARRHFPWR